VGLQANLLVVQSRGGSTGGFLASVVGVAGSGAGGGLTRDPVPVREGGTAAGGRAAVSGRCSPVIRAVVVSEIPASVPRELMRESPSSSGATGVVIGVGDPGWSTVVRRGVPIRLEMKHLEKGREVGRQAC
jgi:hypothetical protein